MESQAFVSGSQGNDGGLFDINLPSNYCNNFLQELDREYDLAEAEKQALESGSITPLVKQELKLLIQSRRLSQGKKEMKVHFGQPCRHQLTHAEEEKRERRKDQNRRAAKRFRQNKKYRESTLLEEISMLEGKNDGLRDKVTQLRRLKDDLLSHLFRHLVTCPSSPTAFLPSSSSSSSSSSSISPMSECDTFTYSPPHSDGGVNPSDPAGVSVSPSPDPFPAVTDTPYFTDPTSHLPFLESLLPATSVPAVTTASSSP